MAVRVFPPLLHVDEVFLQSEEMKGQLNLIFYPIHTFFPNVYTEMYIFCSYKIKVSELTAKLKRKAKQNNKQKSKGRQQCGCGYAKYKELMKRKYVLVSPTS